MHSPCNLLCYDFDTRNIFGCGTSDSFLATVLANVVVAVVVVVNGVFRSVF